MIDFGIAKAVSSPLTDRTLHTQRSELLGTPQYMSPEQAAGGEVDVDTRSDVYALGVLLYELLTGSTPVDEEAARSASLPELQRLIVERPPVKPSDRIRTLGADGGDAAAGSRGSHGPGLRAALRGELDWIVMKALEKDRARRYQSAAVLADDIERKLANRPIEAAPPSAMYRARAFARRHRAGVVAALCVALAVLAGAVTSVVFAVRAAYQRTVAERATGEAMERAGELQAMANDLQAVVDFQAAMLGGFDTAELGRDVLDDLRAQIADVLADSRIDDDEVARQLGALDALLRHANGADLAHALIEGSILREARATLEREFAEQPLVRGMLLRTIGSTSLALGDFAEAEAQLQEALDLLRREVGDRHREPLAARAALATSAYYRGEMAEAARLATAVLHDQRDVLGEEHRDVMRTMRILAVVLDRQGRTEEALELARDSARLHAKVLGASDPATIEMHSTLSTMLITLARYDEAEETTRRALEAAERLSNREPAVYALACRAWLLSLTGRVEDGLEMRRRAFETSREAFGATHRRTVEMATYLGWALRQVDRLDEAEVVLRESHETFARRLGPEHTLTVDARGNLAAVLREAGKLVAAEEELRAVYALRARQVGPDHPRSLALATLLGRCLWQLERYDDARSWLRESLERARRALGPAHEETLSLQLNLGRSLWATGAFDDAAALFEDALDTRVRLQQRSADDPQVLHVRACLGAVALAAGRADEAIERLRPVLDAQRTVGAVHATTRLVTLRHLAAALLATGEAAEAERLLRDALEVAAGQTGTAARRSRADVLSDLGDVLTVAGRHEESESALGEAVELYEALPVPPPTPLVRAMSRLVALYEVWQRPDRARAWRDRLATP